MSLPLSLQNYILDLGLAIPAPLDITFVKALQASHIARYSFNSLAVVMGEDISLDLDDISKKIVERGLGGYCFEHNKLTFELLKALGYDVKLVMARVLNNQEKDVPRTHRLTLLDHQGSKYLIDTGFGGNCPIAPLLFQPDLLQTAGNDVYRILAKANGEYDLQILKEGDYQTMYRFDLAVYTDADCLAGNFYSHRHPTAGFVNNLMVGLKDDSRTIFLINHELIERRQGESKKRVLPSSEALHQVLTNTFGFDVELVIAEHLFDRFLASKLLELKRESKSESQLEGAAS